MTNQETGHMPKNITPSAHVIPFRSAELLLIDHGGQPFVPMKPVAEGMGLSWQGQHEKLTSGRFQATIKEIVIVAGDSKQRAMTCLPLRKLTGWLMSISPNKVKPELRDGIIAYQNECDDVLWAYWNDGVAHNPRAAANDPAPQRLSVVAEDLDAAKRIACALGLEGNQVLLSAGRMVRETTGVDVLELAGVRRLINEAQEHNHTPTELGVKLGLSAARTNKLLAEHGLQRHVEYAAGKKRWELLPAGQPFAVLADTAKRHSDGAPVLQILWKESVLAALRVASQGALIEGGAC